MAFSGSIFRVFIPPISKYEIWQLKSSIAFSDAAFDSISML